MTDKIEFLRDEKGQIISSSPELKEQAIALRKKVGYSILDAKKAIIQANGDMRKAEAILIETEGFRQTKLVTLKY